VAVKGSGARRRGERRGDVTERSILETAERLLAERPLSEISVEELARGAGISRPSFYFYFESREAVLRALAEGITEALYRAAEPWLESGDRPPAEAVRRAIAQNLELWQEHGAVLRAVVRARETDPEIGRLWDGFARRYVEACADHIEQERDAGRAPPGPPSARSLAAMLLNMSDRTWYETALVPRSARARAALVDTMTTVWLRAVYLSDDPR
jgi:TetR/AcrR family transcriptional regulator, ethionamide resistance regulator